MIDELAHLNFEDFDEPFLWKTKKKSPTLLALVHEMHYNFKLFVIHSDTNLTCINTDRILNECSKKKMTDLQCKSTFDIKYSV